METRANELTVEARGRTLYGYAARFDSPTVVGGFTEVIKQGAFARTLSSDKARNIRAIYEHDSRSLLGKVGSGTLRLEEDDKGLAFELDLPDTSLGRDVATLVKRGDIGGMSFGFVANGEDWNGDTRSLKDVDLLEITLTATPAYDSTSVQVRRKESVQMKLARQYLEVLNV